MALELFEYQTKTIRLADFQARQLGTFRDFLTIAPDPQPGIWQVTPRQYVGTLIVDDLHLLIRPKIKPENLFLLLEVGLPEKAWRQEAFQYAHDADLLPALISFYARTVETTLARGVYRSYRPHQEQLIALRGRIDHPRQMARAGVPLPVSCRFDEFTADVAENRYLRAAVNRSLRVATVPPIDRRRLMQHLVTLEEVSDLPVRAQDLDQIHLTRLNAHYQPALRLAHLILKNLTLIDRSGGTAASSFMVNMNDLFQRFVTERLRQALSGRAEVRAEPTSHLDKQGKVRMYPDLVFRHRGREVMVGDIKYKLTADGAGRNADYYQLLAYTTALNLPEGVLIYCWDPQGQPPADLDNHPVTVRHAGKVLHTYAINLSGPPVQAVQEIQNLADWIHEKSLSHVMAGAFA